MAVPFSFADWSSDPTGRRRMTELGGLTPAQHENIMGAVNQGLAKMQPPGLTSVQQSAKYDTGNGTALAPHRLASTIAGDVANGTTTWDKQNQLAQGGAFDPGSGYWEMNAARGQSQLAAADAAQRRNYGTDLSGRSVLADFKPNMLANPYQQGGTAHTAAMNSAYSRPSAGLANALQNTQRSAAERGITMDSGAYQQAQNQNRNDAAKMAAQMGGQVDQQFGLLGAQFDTDQNRYGNDMAFRTGEHLDNFGLQSRVHGLAENNQAFNQSQQLMRNPLEMQGLSLQNQSRGLANDNQRTANQYQGGLLGQQMRAGDQQYAQGQQQLDQGRYTLDGMRQEGELNAAAHPGMLEEIQRQRAMAPWNAAMSAGRNMIGNALDPSGLAPTVLPMLMGGAGGIPMGGQSFPDSFRTKRR